MSNPKPESKRRNYSKSFKQQLVEQALRPGSSVPAIAGTHNVNPELLRRWVRLHRQQESGFVPVKQTNPSALENKSLELESPNKCHPKQAHIQIERGNLRIQAKLDGAQANQIGLILREILQ